MKKEVKRTIILHGQEVVVKTTLTITEQEIQEIFSRKEADFFKAFGCASTTSDCKQNDESEEDHEYEDYLSEEDNSPSSYKPYSSVASRQTPSPEPTEDKEPSKYKPYTSLRSNIPKSYHPETKSGYSPYRTWRVNVPSDKTIIIK